ncbi:MAG: cupin domain-containing protein, partial [Candidatus Acidiferrales bacterium]
FYMLEGQHEFQVGSGRFRLAKGDSIFTPRLIAHAWRKIGQTPGRMLAIAQPAGGLEEFLWEFSGLVSTGLREQTQIVALFGKYSMKIVGPPLSQIS